jgi:hypothetical protein
LRVGRQSGGDRHDILRQRRGQPDGQAGRQQNAERGSARCQYQGGTQQRAFGHNYVAPVEAVSQRCKEQYAQGISQLRECGHQADAAGTGIELGAQHAQHGLAVIQRSDRQSSARGQQQQQ